MTEEEMVREARGIYPMYPTLPDDKLLQFYLKKHPYKEKFLETTETGLTVWGSQPNTSLAPVPNQEVYDLTTRLNQIMRAPELGIIGGWLDNKGLRYDAENASYRTKIASSLFEVQTIYEQVRTSQIKLKHMEFRSELELRLHIATIDNAIGVIKQASAMGLSIEVYAAYMMERQKLNAAYEVEKMTVELEIYRDSADLDRKISLALRERRQKYLLLDDTIKQLVELHLKVAELQNGRNIGLEVQTTIRYLNQGISQLQRDYERQLLEVSVQKSGRSER
jgi:hypothetical protein